MISTTDRLVIIKDRLNRLKNSPKNIKCPGVCRKLSRQVRNIEKTVD